MFNGIRKNDYEGILKDYQLLSPEQTSVKAFKQKFLVGGPPKSSQITSRTAKPRFYDVLKERNTAEVLHGPSDRTWKLQKEIPTPCFVNANKFETNFKTNGAPNNTAEIRQASLRVRVPKDNIGNQPNS